MSLIVTRQGVDVREPVTRWPVPLVLSLYHGADLFGRGFEAAGFCVVRAAEKDLGFDAAELRLASGKFDGIIAGTPCNDFSLANRWTRSYSGDGVAQLRNFGRLVLEAMPDWFVLENVAQVPDVSIEGYTMQRFDLNARECGLKQNRLRHFQFGSRSGVPLIIERDSPADDWEACVTASEFERGAARRGFAKFCELQGLPSDYDLPYLRVSQKYRVVAQGVPVPMASIIAKAIRDRARIESLPAGHAPCACGCGRVVSGRVTRATPACRKRIQRQRDSAGHNSEASVTAVIDQGVNDL